jgi:membrane carboxypeptidase/penicillin-binding protein
MGFDHPRPMGGYAQGGTLAAPIFKQFALAAFKDMPARAVPSPRPESAWCGSTGARARRCSAPGRPTIPRRR